MDHPPIGSDALDATDSLVTLSLDPRHAPAVVANQIDGDVLWLVVVGVAAALLITGLTHRHRRRRRRRRELRDSASADIEPLLVTGLSTTPPGGREPDDSATDDPTNDGVSGDEAEAHTERVGETLAELTRISRAETAAAATALRHHAVELGRALTSRLRGEGDPNLLAVRITELRERVRGAQDRLDAAVGR